MTSSKQIEANQANAKRSTGPKTEAGKARSRMNSRKHGLTAEVIVVGDENGDDFSEFREALLEQYDPQTPMECELVERLAGILWRLRRVPVFEAGVIDFRVEQVLEEERRRQAKEWERQEMLRHVVAEARREEPKEDEEEEAEEKERGRR